MEGIDLGRVNTARYCEIRALRVFLSSERFFSSGSWFQERDKVDGIRKACQQVGTQKRSVRTALVAAFTPFNTALVNDANARIGRVRVASLNAHTE